MPTGKFGCNVICLIRPVSVRTIENIKTAPAVPHMPSNMTGKFRTIGAATLGTIY